MHDDSKKNYLIFIKETTEVFCVNCVYIVNVIVKFKTYKQFQIDLIKNKKKLYSSIYVKYLISKRNIEQILKIIKEM